MAECLDAQAERIEKNLNRVQVARDLHLGDR